MFDGAITTFAYMKVMSGKAQLLPIEGYMNQKLCTLV